MSDGERILVVDDDEHLLSVLRDYLAFEGFDVTTAETAEAALAKIDASPPDLIILDISMPGMGGLGFLRRIQGPDARPRYPVLVFSARSAMGAFFDTISVDGFLAKPAPEAELVRKIRAILTARRPEGGRRARLRKRILVAETEPDTAEAVQVALAGAGYDVEVVADGPSVLERAARTQPDLILVREILPKMNGSVLAPVVAAMPSTRDVPFVLYDDTLADAERRGYRYNPPSQVTRYLRTSEAGEILRTVRDLLAD